VRLRYDLARLEALERDWDPKLGGPITRPYRDLLCYCVGRLLGNGAQLEDVAGHLRVAREEAIAAAEVEFPGVPGAES